MAISRRDLIRNGLVALSVGAAAPHFLIRAAHATPRAAEALKAAGARALIVVEMAGGNDGLNTVIPYADEAYYRARPELAVPRQDALTISDSVALHSSLASFKELYDRGRLAVVQGAGYPNFNFSHFRAMEIYRSGDTGAYTGVGWLGRYLDTIVAQANGVPFTALVAGQPGINPAVSGDTFDPVAVQNANAYQITTDPRFGGDRQNRLNAFNALNKTGSDRRAMLPLLEDTADAAYASSRELQDLVRGYSAVVEYPNTDIGNSLKLMAQVVTADVGLQVGYVTKGGFDTHAQQNNEQNGQPVLLRQVSDAIGAFLADIEAHGIADRVVVLAWSEFGRRVEENGSEGTDHGSAQPMFVAGVPVKGGLYGAHPSLTDLENKNLRMTTDFRSVYATLLSDWLKTEPAPILKGDFPNLGFVA
jgi:uncharacterized protein (DUF1501 family)